MTHKDPEKESLWSWKTELGGSKKEKQYPGEKVLAPNPGERKKKKEQFLQGHVQ